MRERKSLALGVSVDACLRQPWVRKFGIGLRADPDPAFADPSSAGAGEPALDEPPNFSFIAALF
jgi:hypothetical protein